LNGYWATWISGYAPPSPKSCPKGRVQIQVHVHQIRTRGDLPLGSEEPSQHEVHTGERRTWVWKKQEEEQVPGSQCHPQQSWIDEVNGFWVLVID